jgi:hypothetical protein
MALFQFASANTCWYNFSTTAALVHAKNFLEPKCLCCPGEAPKSAADQCVAPGPGYLLVDWPWQLRAGRVPDRPTQSLIDLICSYNIRRDAEVLQQSEP